MSCTHQQYFCNAVQISVLQQIPPVAKLARFSTEAELKEFLDKINPLCFPLLRWIITSNRTHLELLPPHKQFKSMQTPWQFIMRSSTPEKERQHAEEVQSHGSFFAFHGSAYVLF